MALCLYHNNKCVDDEALLYHANGNIVRYRTTGAKLQNKVLQTPSPTRAHTQATEVLLHLYTDIER